MSRAHIQGFDSNAAQFDRMGNPWMTSREQQELGDPNRKARRENRRSRPFDPNFRDPPVSRRALTEAEQQAESVRHAMRDVVSRLRASRGDFDRTHPTYEPRHVAPHVIRPLNNDELNPWDTRAIEATRVKLERRHAQAVAENQTRHLDQMQKQLTRYGKKLDRILG